MKNYVRIGALCVLLAVSATAFDEARAQGCIVSRGTGVQPFTDFEAEAGQIETSLSYRFLHSHRHFVGSVEQHERAHEGSEVINRSHFIDAAVRYSFDERFSATLTLPFATHDRSQVVRGADRTILQRFHTQSSGLADVRLMANGWLWTPGSAQRGNVQLGLGVDIPTGKDDVEDTFQTLDAASGRIVGVRRTVDQSIQPGDGGWGVLLDVYAFRTLRPRWSVFASASYALTPEENQRRADLSRQSVRGGDVDRRLLQRTRRHGDHALAGARPGAQPRRADRGCAGARPDGWQRRLPTAGVCRVNRAWAVRALRCDCCEPVRAASRVSQPRAQRRRPPLDRIERSVPPRRCGVCGWVGDAESQSRVLAGGH